MVFNQGQSYESGLDVKVRFLVICFGRFCLIRCIISNRSLKESCKDRSTDSIAPVLDGLKGKVGVDDVLLPYD